MRLSHIDIHEQVTSEEETGVRRLHWSGPSCRILKIFRVISVIHCLESVTSPLLAMEITGRALLREACLECLRARDKHSSPQGCLRAD